MSNPLAKIIATKGWCVVDGATGTNLLGVGWKLAIPQNYGQLNGPTIFCGCITILLMPGRT